MYHINNTRDGKKSYKFANKVISFTTDGLNKHIITNYCWFNELGSEKWTKILN